MPLFGEVVKYINFENKTDLPLQICSWVDGSNALKTTRIGPGEKWMLHSSVGEWHMDSMFYSGPDRDCWVKAGLQKYSDIGKFRSRPCIRGEYSWMEYDEPFHCEYSENENDNVKGNILFTRRKQ
jgi:hypothetical protein